MEAVGAFTMNTLRSNHIAMQLPHYYSQWCNVRGLVLQSPATDKHVVMLGAERAALFESNLEHNVRDLCEGPLDWTPQRMKERFIQCSDLDSDPFSAESRKCEGYRLLARVSAELPKEFYPFLDKSFRMPAKKMPRGSTLALRSAIVKKKERRPLSWWCRKAELLRRTAHDSDLLVREEVTFHECDAVHANKAMSQLITSLLQVLGRPSSARVASVLLMGKKNVEVLMKHEGHFSSADASVYELLFAHAHLILVCDVWRRNTQHFLTADSWTKKKSARHQLT
jgi:hypothetical protein